MFFTKTHFEKIWGGLLYGKIIKTKIFVFSDKFSEEFLFVIFFLFFVKRNQRKSDALFPQIYANQTNFFLELIKIMNRILQ